MSRNLNPRVKRQRRIGEKLMTHGEKSFSRRPYPPGQHGPKGTGKQSEYSIRLREKQKAQLTYGILERQFRTYINRAKRRIGDTGEYLLALLEMRLDNVVFRAGFARSREGARQLVRHGHITVNGKRVTIPSYQVAERNTVSFYETSRKRPGIQLILKELENSQPPQWLSIDRNTATVTVQNIPTFDSNATNINPQLIVEFYSR